MIWTKEKPTESGWYWVKHMQGKEVIENIHEFHVSENTVWIYDCGYSGREDFELGKEYDGYEFAGPIEKPKP